MRNSVERRGESERKLKGTVRGRRDEVVERR
jgi:hypothetical protein